MFLESLETGLGLDIIIALQSMQNPVFDAVAESLNFMGLGPFFLVFLPFIYWSVDRRLGTRLLVALLVGGIGNTLLKELFASPRPFVVSDEVFQLFEASGYGFPSGHVMVAVVLWGYLAYHLQKRWASVLYVIYVVLMAWSRMYAGVHYPQDVVGGAVFGGLLLIAYIWLIEELPGLWMRLTTQTRIALLVFLVITLSVFILPDEFGQILIGVLSGVGIGAVIKDWRGFRFKAPEETGKQIMNFAIGIICLVALYVGLSVLFDALADEGTDGATLLRTTRYFILGLFAFIIYPLLAVRFNLLRLEDQENVAEA